MLDRRGFLRVTGSATVLAAGTAAGCRPREERPTWTPAAFRKPDRSPVAILPAAVYDEALLVDVVSRGIGLFGLDVRGKRVVLKPNLVEFDPDGVINTHPVLLAAAVEAFRRADAASVTVAEGPGHRRDNEYLLTASGLWEVLREMDAPYVDLNHDAVRRTRLESTFTQLGELYLPDTVMGADLFVSMPKLKTHHWAGVTLSMKNLFGIVPGSLYGWPKNLLHWAGLSGSIIDINAAIPVPRFAIVDGIVGMEGNGPIQGEAKHVGVVAFGEDPVAVDSTCARLMSIDPWKIDYLASVEPFLGNVGTSEIEQRGEELSRFRQDFAVLGSFEGIKVASTVTAG